MAYIYARTKSGKGFKMGVEDKHIYKNFDEYYIYVNRNPNNAAAATESAGNPYCINSSKLVAYNITNGFELQQGTDENQRVGNKVFLKFIHLTYYINMNGEQYINNFSHGQAIDSYYRLRVMVVQFDDVMSEPAIAEWFRDTYTYFRMQAIYQTTVPRQSVHTAKLRESTPYTGSFKILYDKKTCLKKNKTVKMSTINIPIKQNINFENTNNLPTDGSMKNIYLIVIGPCYNDVDMDTISEDQGHSLQSDVPLFNAACVAKYEYYDL